MKTRLFRFGSWAEGSGVTLRNATVPFRYARKGNGGSRSGARDGVVRPSRRARRPCGSRSRRRRGRGPRGSGSSARSAAARGRARAVGAREHPAALVGHLDDDRVRLAAGAHLDRAGLVAVQVGVSTALVTASETASETAASASPVAPAASANALTALRASATEAATAGHTQESRAGPADSDAAVGGHDQHPAAPTRARAIPSGEWGVAASGVTGGLSSRRVRRKAYALVGISAAADARCGAA